MIKLRDILMEIGGDDAPTYDYALAPYTSDDDHEYSSITKFTGDDGQPYEVKIYGHSPRFSNGTIYISLKFPHTSDNPDDDGAYDSPGTTNLGQTLKVGATTMKIVKEFVAKNEWVRKIEFHVGDNDLSKAFRKVDTFRKYVMKTFPDAIENYIHDLGYQYIVRGQERYR